MKKNRWFAALAAMVMALAAFGCKTDTETEYVDKRQTKLLLPMLQNLPLKQKTAEYFLHGKMLLTATFTATK